MDLGVCILILAYGADKYEVLNRLCYGNRNKIVTFARGDIRHRHWRMKYLLLLVLALIVLLEMFEEVIFLNVTGLTR